MLRVSDKLKTIFTDTLWSIAGLVLMNVAAQFVVYPYWNRTLGSEAYGNIVYLLAVMNILAISVGIGINYARMRRSAEEDTANRPYSRMMAAGTVISLFVLFILYAVGLINATVPEFLLFCALTAATTWRYYADVEYRLRINYKGYFFYYLVIGLGYLLGIWLFQITGLWPMALLPGEVAGLLLVLFKGKIFRKDAADKVNDIKPIVRLSLLLVGTNLLSHLIFNGDRIILQLFAGSTAVSVYYIASLFGKTMTFISTPLNSVLVGHLAKSDGILSRNTMHKVTLLTVVAIAVATGICVVVSMIILPFLYPSEYLEVKKYLLIANAAQVIYFTGNILTGSVLLRFTPAVNQVIVNVTHGILFGAVCIPTAWSYGVGGFCWGLLSVNVFRFGLSIILGYKGVVNER